MMPAVVYPSCFGLLISDLPSIFFFKKNQRVKANYFFFAVENEVFDAIDIKQNSQKKFREQAKLIDMARTDYSEPSSLWWTLQHGGPFFLRETSKSRGGIFYFQ